MVFSSEDASSITMAHSNEVDPTHSASRSHALFGVTLPCPGKCWACKTELSIIQHEQEDVWSDMGGGQGPTKPRADRGYHFDVSVWACGVEQGALGNLLRFFPFLSQCSATPHSLYPACYLPSLRCSTYINIIVARTACTMAYTEWHESGFFCPLTKQEQAAVVKDNKVVNGWFWRNSVVAVSQEQHYSFIQWIPKVPLSRVSSRSHTIASLITLSSVKREVNGWHFATPWVLLPITIETQIRPN